MNGRGSMNRGELRVPCVVPERRSDERHTHKVGTDANPDDFTRVCVYTRDGDRAYHGCEKRTNKRHVSHLSV